MYRAWFEDIEKYKDDEVTLSIINHIIYSQNYYEN